MQVCARAYQGIVQEVKVFEHREVSQAVDFFPF